MAIKKKVDEPVKAAAKKTAAPAKKAAEPKKTLATVPKDTTTGLQVFDPSILEQDSQADKGTFGKEDLATPFLRVLQALSPQINDPEKKVDGAEAGMFIDTSDSELWDGEDGILVVPVHYTPSFIEWKLREKGGGYVKDHGPVAPDIPTTRDDKNREIMPNGNQLVKSGLYYVFVVDPESKTGAFKQLAFPLQGSQLKKSRAWNTQMKSLRLAKSDGTGEYTPAMFYMTWRITSLFEKNDVGSWYGVKIEPHKPLPELFPDTPQLGWAIYTAAREFKDMIAQGRVRTQVMEAEAEVVSNEGVDAAY